VLSTIIVFTLKNYIKVGKLSHNKETPKLTLANDQLEAQILIYLLQSFTFNIHGSVHRSMTQEK
jgi:hypothetical protein